jgi:chromosome segregation ATPase
MSASDMLRFFAIIILTVTVPAFAQDKAGKEREALVRMQRALSKAQQDNSALSREKAELSAKLEVVQKTADAAKSDMTRVRQRTTVAEGDLRVLKEEHEGLKRKLEEAEKQLVASGERLKNLDLLQQKTDSERVATGARLKQESGALQICTAANDKLYVLVRDVSRQYERSAREQADPVFGLRLVEIENQLELYRDRADEGRLRRP